ncbi:MAG: hypothetical protein MKZ75_05145 [Acidimicrobiales bacterium]|nr:hypothetical protein [Acidimicrobiales bacterium]MEC9113703.1 hypothetical protein [Actinomycetota bacterium]
MSNENPGHNDRDLSLTDSALDDLEVELSKVEATMQALADGAEIDSATSWLHRS